MARSVSLSDDAFSALREEKREGESDSDVVLRLRREARARRKDPSRFFRVRLPSIFPDEEEEAHRRKMAEADTRDPWGE